MRIATDIGGTFTDLVAVDEKGKTILGKSHTTPPNFEEGVIEVIKKRVELRPKKSQIFIHGTTDDYQCSDGEKGCKDWDWITTKGFRDVLELARCNRPDLFNMVFAKPRPFIPRYLRREVAERIAYDGKIVIPLEETDIEKAVEYFKEEGVEAVAVLVLSILMPMMFTSAGQWRRSKNCGRKSLSLLLSK